MSQDDLEMAPVSEELLERAAGILRAGGVVLYPTDTVAGLGADVQNPGAIARVFQIKGRRGDAPVPLLLSDPEMLCRYTRTANSAAEGLAAAFWPGALTIVVRVERSLATAIGSDNATGGFRVPDHAVCRDMIRRFGSAITGTSANRSGDAPGSSTDLVAREVSALVDMVIPGRGKPGSASSTVVDCTVDPPRVVREGAIGTDALRSVIEVV